MTLFKPPLTRLEQVALGVALMALSAIVAPPAPDEPDAGIKLTCVSGDPGPGEVHCDGSAVLHTDAAVHWNDPLPAGSNVIGRVGTQQ